MFVTSSLVVTCWERADLLALLYVKFSCAFVTFPYGVLGEVWYLFVSIPDLCLLPYFRRLNAHIHFSHGLSHVYVSSIEKIIVENIMF